MDEFIRVLQTGEIDTGDRLLQFATLKSISLLSSKYNDYDHFQTVYGFALDRGAVCFEVDANYDVWETYHTEDEVSDFGFDGEMTYGEYWQKFPEDRMERPEPCWQTWVLLCVAPFMHLRSPIYDHMLVSQFGYLKNGGKYFLAMTLAPANPIDEPEIIFRPDPQQPLVLKPGKIVPPQPGNGNAEADTWQLGEATILTTYTQLPKPPLALRSWEWGFRSGGGPPVDLFIYLKPDPDLDQTAPALANWFTGLTLPKYRLIDEWGCRLWFQADGQIQSDYVLQNKPNAKGIRFAQGPADEPYSFYKCLTFSDRCIDLTHLCEQNNPTDSGILAAILAGELGEVSWDLFEGDYGVIEACGYDLASLREYLDSTSDAKKQLAHWQENIYRRISATTATTWQQVAETIAEHLQIPPSQDDATVALIAWLEQTPRSQIPRVIYVYVDGETGLVDDPDLQNLVERLNNAVSVSTGIRFIYLYALP